VQAGCDADQDPGASAVGHRRRVFWVPADARWDTIQSRAKLASIGQDIDTAMDLIEKENPVIRGVLPRNYGRVGLDKGRLGQLVDLIGFIGFTETDDHGSDDVLGRVYEYFLGQFAGKETGKDAGALYTPRSVVRTLVEMLEPFQRPGVRPVLRVRRHVRRVGEVRGSPQRQAHRRLRLRPGVHRHHVEASQDERRPTRYRADLGERSADSFGADLDPDLRADFVLANPPFNVSNWWDAKPPTTHAGRSACHRRATPTSPGCSTSSITCRPAAQQGSCSPTITVVQKQRRG